MWIVRLALRRPYTFVVLALAIILVTPLVLMRTPTDIFPEINIPVVTIAWTYTGLSPLEMERRVTSTIERGATTMVNDIEHLESQSLPGMTIIKLFFHPRANISTALAQTAAATETMMKWLPPGATPPLVIIYSASTVPVIQIGLTSDTMSEQELFDLGTTYLRPKFTTVPGAAIPWPYGGKQRFISVDIDSAALQSKGLSPVDIVNAMNQQNLILPTGTAKLGQLEYNVEMNGSPRTVAELNDLPVKSVNGSTIYMKEVAHVRDGFSPQTNIVRANGRRGVIMSILKTGGTSTLEVVSRVKEILQYYSGALPEGLHVTTFFDQSLFVRAAIQGVIREALIAACLTAVMILLFLGNWKSTLIIAISIPLSILVSVIALGALGENINRNLAMGKETMQAILDGAAQIAVPAFVSTICICIVFIPMFFLSGVAKFLFVPLAEAVIFAMLASYFWSRTIVPTLAMYLLSAEDEYRADEHVGEKMGFFRRYQQGFEQRFEAFRDGYRRALATALHHSWLFTGCFLGFCVLSGGLTFVIGRDYFPSVDAGQIRLHMRARSGLRIEETARLADQVETAVKEIIPKRDLVTILDNIGLPYSSINMTYSNAGTIGTSDAEILLQLKKDRGSSTEAYIRGLRELLPQRFPSTQFFFQPPDIVSQILNFGMPAPIDIEVMGQNLVGNYQIAEKLVTEIQHIPGAVDVHVQQAFDDPTLHMEIDRTRAQSVGLQARDIAQNLLVSLSSSFQTAPVLWMDPKNGATYQVAVQTPQYRVDSMQALANTPVTGAGASGSDQPPQILGNLVSISSAMRPAVVSHYDIEPLINVYAAVDGRDLGAVSDEIAERVHDIEKELPRGSHITVRGQVQTMKYSFQGLALGLVGAIVLAYLLIVVNFQSWLDPFIIITALPGALAGICWMLFLTHTTLSVPSMIGAMVPLAIGLGEGGEQNAPLGRAVIGGLIFATFATLFFVPTVFSIIHGRRERRRGLETATAPVIP